MLLTGDQVLLKRLNRAALLWLLRTRPGLARVDLARTAGLTKATVGTLVEELCNEGWLCEGKTVANRAGRPSTPLYIDETRRFALGLDLSPAGLRAVAVGLRGEVLAETALERRQTGRMLAFERLSDVLEPLLGSASLRERSPLGVGWVDGFDDAPLAPQDALKALGASLGEVGLYSLPLVGGSPFPAAALAEALFSERPAPLAFVQLGPSGGVGWVLGESPRMLEHAGRLPEPADDPLRALEGLGALMGLEAVVLGGPPHTLEPLLAQGERGGMSLRVARYGQNAAAVGAAALLLDALSRPVVVPGLLELPPKGVGRRMERAIAVD